MEHYFLIFNQKWKKEKDKGFATDYYTSEYWMDENKKYPKEDSSFTEICIDIEKIFFILVQVFIIQVYLNNK